MKKMLKLGVVLLAIFLLSGCFGGGGATKTLNCTISEEEFGMQNYGEIDVEFRGDEVKKITMEMSMEFESAEEAEMSYEFIAGMYEEMDAEEGVTVSTDMQGAVLTITMSVDVDRVPEGDFSDDFFGSDFDETITYEELKAELEAEGFTCR